MGRLWSAVLRLLGGVGLLQSAIWSLGLMSGAFAAGFANFPLGFRIALGIGVAGFVVSAAGLAVRHVPALQGLGRSTAPETLGFTGGPLPLERELRQAIGAVLGDLERVRSRMERGLEDRAWWRPSNALGVVMWDEYGDRINEQGHHDEHALARTAVRLWEEVNDDAKKAWETFNVHYQFELPTGLTPGMDADAIQRVERAALACHAAESALDRIQR